MKYAPYLACILLLAACSSELEDGEGANGDGLVGVVFDGDMALPAQWDGAVYSAGPGTPESLYLNFDGAVISPSGWSFQNALTDSSFIAQSPSTLAPFDGSYWASDRELVIEAVLEVVRTDFAAFDVAVVRERPSQGTYTMIAIGGVSSDLGMSSQTLGVAPFDSSNWNPNDVGFVFSDSVGQSGYNHEHLGHVISHEIAHTLGLSHVDVFNDIMSPQSCFCSQSWGSGPLSGQPGQFQDDLEKLAEVFDSAPEPEPLPLPLPEPEPEPEPNPSPEPTPPVEDSPAISAWVGSECISNAGCDYSHAGNTSAGTTVGQCLAWFDESEDETFGLCSSSCQGYCPDLAGQAPTFCTEVFGQGQCVVTPQASNDFCDEAMGTYLRAVERYVGTSSASKVWRNACVPASSGSSCQVGSSVGNCVDTSSYSCGGSLHSGLCPGPGAIRCCVE